MRYFLYSSLIESWIEIWKIWNMRVVNKIWRVQLAYVEWNIFHIPFFVMLCIEWLSHVIFCNGECIVNGCIITFFFWSDGGCIFKWIYELCYFFLVMVDAIFLSEYKWICNYKVIILSFNDGKKNHVTSNLVGSWSMVNYECKCNGDQVRLKNKFIVIGHK